MSAPKKAAPSARDSRRHFLLHTGLTVGAVTVAAVPPPVGAADPPPECEAPPPPDGKQKQAPPYRFPRLARTRVRKSVHEVAADGKELARLEKAYRMLKDLDKKDPRSWCQQANLHEKHCAHGPGDRPTGEDAQHLQIHFGWYFLPWHRAYLYFYEGILAELLKDDTFALPYWDWTQNPTLPDVFFDPKSPLHHPNRAAKKGDSIEKDPAVRDVTRRDALDAIQAIPYFHPPLPGLTGSFGGPPDNDQASGQLQGALESGPHNAIHNWVGGDMGSFDTAARDFVFFLHHANVDRIWADWLLLAGHTNPSSPTWQTQWFNFTDPQRNEVSVTAGDTVDFMKVNVLYQAASTRLVRDKAPAAVLTLEGKPVTADVRTPLALDRTPKVPGRQRRTVRLAVEGFEDPGDVALRVHAFLNKPDADARTPLTDEHYAGTFFIVPLRSAKAHGHGGEKPTPSRVLSLDVSDRAAALLAEQPLKVTLVPVDREQKPNSAKVRFRSVTVVVDD
jgi:polyphenol oxidase